MLEIRDLEVNHGAVQAVRGLNLRAPNGQITTVIGSNGAGKTTLLKAISGLYPVAKGSVVLFGDDISNLDAADVVRKGVSQVPEGRELFPRMTVADNLLVGAHLRRGAGIRSDMEKVYHYFPVLRQKSKLTAKSLSGGEQQMLAFGRALMSKPRVMLLDEPSTGLSPLIEKSLMDTVAKLAGEQDIGILLVEQNATMALSLARYAYVLETGSVVLEGDAKSLSNNPQVQAAYLGL